MRDNGGSVPAETGRLVDGSIDLHRVSAIAGGDAYCMVLMNDGTVRTWRCELCGGLDALTALAHERLGGTGRPLTEEERVFLNAESRRLRAIQRGKSPTRP